MSDRPTERLVQCPQCGTFMSLGGADDSPPPVETEFACAGCRYILVLTDTPLGRLGCRAVRRGDK